MCSRTGLHRMEQLRNVIVDDGLSIRTHIRAVTSGDEAADAFAKMYKKDSNRLYHVVLDLNGTETSKIISRMVHKPSLPQNSQNYHPRNISLFDLRPVQVLFFKMYF